MEVILGSREVEARLEYVEGTIRIEGMMGHVFLNRTNCTDGVA